MNNEMYLNFLVSFLSVGTVVSMLKFIIDRVFSVAIEFELENNYNRAFRELFNYVCSVIYLIFVGGTIYLALTTNKEKNKMDVITGGHYKFTQNDLNELDTLIEKETNITAIILVIVLLIFGAIIYGMIRSFWYKNYRKKFYLELEGRKFYIKKRFSKDKVLLIDENRAYRIIDFDNLDNLDFKQESVEKRNTERYIAYYKDFKDIKKWQELTIKTRVIIGFLLVLLMIFLVFLFVIQEDKISFTVTLLVIPTVMFIYLNNQYKHGKKIIEEKATFFYSVKFLSQKNSAL